MKGKNGIELEAWVQQKDLINDKCLGFIHKKATNRFKRIYDQFYYDDGKPEFPSKPYSSLDELFSHVREIIVQVIDICDRNYWLFSSIGCHPFASTFASFHVHTSLNEVPKEQDVPKLRAMFLDSQPYIALLSQNSPCIVGRKAEFKDVRLAYSDWSRFTDTREVENDDHYLSLATGRDAWTLECRIPSSCSLHQGEAVVVFLKTLAKLEQKPFLPIDSVKNLFYRVLQWGSQALISLPDINKLNYLGLGQQILVPISEMMKLFLTDKNIRPIFTEVIGELPRKDRKYVVEYFELLADGYTASDYILNLCKLNHWNIKKISEELFNITKASYLSNIPFWKIIPKPERPELPKIEEVYSIEEALELLKQQALTIKLENKNDLDIVLNTSKYSLRKCEATRLIVSELIKHEEVSSHMLAYRMSQYTKVFSFLKRHKIIRETTSISIGCHYKAGENFPYLVQLAQRAGLI